MCFNVYLEFVLIKHGKMTDMEAISPKKDFLTHNFPENGEWMPCRAMWGITRVDQKAEGAREKHGQRLYHDSCKKEGVGKLSKLSIA